MGTPLWSHSRADAGHTCWVDAEPLRAPPRVRWVASPFGHVSDLVAGPSGVVVSPTFLGVPARVLDPETGAVRQELHGTTWCRLEEDRVVAARDAEVRAGALRFQHDTVKRGRRRVTVVRALDALTGEARWERPGHLVAADGAGALVRRREPAGEVVELVGAEGAPRWQVEAERPNPDGAPGGVDGLALAPGHVVLRRGTATCEGWFEALVVVDRSTGAEVQRLGPWHGPGRVAVARDVLFAPLVGPQLVATTLAGERLWELDLAPYLDHVDAVAAVHGGLYVLGSSRVVTRGVATLTGGVLAIEAALARRRRA